MSTKIMLINDISIENNGDGHFTVTRGNNAPEEYNQPHIKELIRKEMVVGRAIWKDINQNRISV